MALLRSLAKRQLSAASITRSTPCTTVSRTYSVLCTRSQLASPSSRVISQCQHQQQQRRYASKKAKSKSTDSFVPGSQQKIQDETARAEYEKAESTMKTAVEWFRKECAGFETRASGRVTPALLSPVRVTLPGDQKEYRLEELATVGVREGSTLLVTLFEEGNMKHVESALHTCGIPGVVPHKQDNRTIKIPIPKPTVDSRHSLYASAKKKAEEIRTQVRKQHTLSLKKGKFEKHSIETEEFQKLTDKYIGEIDKILKELQKATGAK